LGVSPKTIIQKPGVDDRANASEAIEIHDTKTLTLQDRRIINLLYANAGTKICNDICPVIGIAELRGTHRGSEL
jgi:hypothetical protein